MFWKIGKTCLKHWQWCSANNSECWQGGPEDMMFHKYVLGRYWITCWRKWINFLILPWWPGARNTSFLNGPSLFSLSSIIWNSGVIVDWFVFDHSCVLIALSLRYIYGLKPKGQDWDVSNLKIMEQNKSLKSTCIFTK